MELQKETAPDVAVTAQLVVAVGKSSSLCNLLLQGSSCDLPLPASFSSQLWSPLGLERVPRARGLRGAPQETHPVTQTSEEERRTSRKNAKKKQPFKRCCLYFLPCNFGTCCHCLGSCCCSYLPSTHSILVTGGSPGAHRRTGEPRDWCCDPEDQNKRKKEGKRRPNSQTLLSVTCPTAAIGTRCASKLLCSCPTAFMRPYNYL
jgi:hypothetical protein